MYNIGSQTGDGEVRRSGRRTDRSRPNGQPYRDAHAATTLRLLASMPPTAHKAQYVATFGSSIRHNV